MGVNPRIAKIDLGVRELKTYTIYPLSMADQFKLTDAIAEAAKTFSDAGESAESEVTAVKVGLSFIQENIDAILKMITEEDNRPSLDELDNYQFSELVEIIFDVNYGNTIKNFQSLMGKMKNMFPSMRQSLSSSQTPATD